MNLAITPRRVALSLAVLIFLAYIGPATGTTTFFYRDYGVLAYPTAAYHKTMFLRGELPLWNPYSNSGVPFLAQWGTMTLYPFSLFYLLLPLPWSLNVFCLAHLWWGALGVFYLARRWSKSDPGAALASVLFLFNGLTLSTLAWPNYTVAFAWMPWIILFAESAWQRGGRARIAATLAGSMQMFSGVPEVILLTWFLIALLWLAAFLQRKTSPIKNPLALPLIVILIGGIAAIQLLPFFELLAHSQRQTGANASKWALPFTALGNFLLPMLHAFMTPQGTWHQHGQHFLSSTYLGLPAILLAAVGIIRGGTRARILALAALFCILLALGPNLPLFTLIENIPVLGLARYPVKFTLLLALLIPLLAAFGYNSIGKTFSATFAALFLLAILLMYWTRSHPLQYDHWPSTYPNSVIHLVAFICVAGILFLSSRRPKSEYFIVLLLLLAADGRFNIADQNPTTQTATLTAPVPDRPLPKLGEGRIFISPAAEDAFLNAGMTNRNAEFIGKHLAGWSHLNLLELVPKVNGSATLNVREQKVLQDWLYAKTNLNTPEHERWLNLLSVTHVTSSNSIVEYTSRPDAYPLVRLSSGTPETKIEVHNFSEHEILATINSPKPDVLVIAQTPYPAWKATANGSRLNPAKVQIENSPAPLLAFNVPSGPTNVRIFYRDDRFLIGALISFFSLAACCSLTWLSKSK